MCDRVLILSSNPGRVAAEIKVTLQHPRNRLDPEFRQLVDSIYGRMTQRTEAKQPAHAQGAITGLGFGMMLPRMSTNVLAGLLETLAAPPYNGKADLPAIAATLQLEVDELFPAAEALQVLRFAEVETGDIKLTPAGKRFAEADTDQRKKMFADHLTTYIPLAARIRRVLDERSSHRAPADRFMQELEDYMGDEAAETTLRTVTNWGRYAEMFAYDETSKVFSLENPA